MNKDKKPDQPMLFLNTGLVHRRAIITNLMSMPHAEDLSKGVSDEDFTDLNAQLAELSKSHDVFEEAAVQQFESDLQKALDAQTITPDEFTKGMLDRSKLHQKTITDKHGHTRKVWVKEKEAAKAEEKKPEQTYMQMTGGDDSWSPKKQAIHLAKLLKMDDYAAHLEKLGAGQNSIARLRGMEEIYDHHRTEGTIPHEHTKESGEGSHHDEDLQENEAKIGDIFDRFEHDGNLHEFYNELSKHYEPEDDGESEGEMMENVAAHPKAKEIIAALESHHKSLGNDGQGHIIGKTSTGKDIFETADHPGHKDFTSKEHNDAAKLHIVQKNDDAEHRMDHHNQQINKHTIMAEDAREKAEKGSSDDYEMTASPEDLEADWDDLAENEGEDYADAVRNVREVQEKTGGVSKTHIQKYVDMGEDETGWSGTADEMENLLKEHGLIRKKS